MNEEIMNNNEEMEDEEVQTRRPMTGLEKAGGVALLALAGFGIYKGVKAIAKRAKAKKQSRVDRGTYEDQYIAGEEIE